MEPVFSSGVDAVNVAWHFIQRLAVLVSWMLIALAHLTIACLALFALWAFQLTPTDIQTGFQAMVSAKPVLTYVALGGSAFGLTAGYWKLVRWAHKATYSGWLYEFLKRGLRTS